MEHIKDDLSDEDEKIEPLKARPPPERENEERPMYDAINSGKRRGSYCRLRMNKRNRSNP